MTRCSKLAVACLTLAFSGALRAAATGGACAALSEQVSQSGSGPIFLASYPDAERGPLNHTAFTYDNAVASIALVACGQIPAARRIADALLMALAHDRFWKDGRIRNAYVAGAATTNPLKLPGWWDAGSRRWLEDGYQVGSDGGNMAWSMLALLTLDAVSTDRRYRDGAVRLGRWMEQAASSEGAAGFAGGVFGEESAPKNVLWRSTEHNTDLAAAYAWLARASGEPRWQMDSLLASGFVMTMWRPQCDCFAVGVGEDGVTPNLLLALDAQIWPLLALPGAAGRYAAVLGTVERRLSSGQGLRYSESGQGQWTEGTAQAAVLMQLMQQQARAQRLLQALASARAADGGYFASNLPATATGFMLDTDPGKPREYFHLEHLGALAWVALAEQRFNPFTGARQLPP